MTNTENNPQNGSKERAVVYVRVSSKKQAEEGVSIAAQTEKGKEIGRASCRERV